MTISTRSRGRSDTGNTPNKRQKVEEHVQEAPPPEEAQPVVGERHASLWFDEGNVVLAAQGKSFKLHSGVLAHHSKVFRDLLSAPALASLQERLDGCPVLRTDDNGDVLAQLLQIVYDGAKRCAVLLLLWL
ncbi:uncharacterized protein PHACADRAFT_253008 [Phanerochaete carnosa HHB-10118-sp]|uniref:BTB domain-containing protein n=1 Tax=Phanerochaete carnosa (strain HHB-10118-sp) TaxID=650164 RepID=K5WGV5_PHACS|nr:uncharacterized protein PHACADRAFT_253008 [Phanerochaete carnosa HHB-10118-sp]EKM58565.1 hypothetical protein PHACADRAFT_253008 [Phanerochaete carnosa HHB-10118-sp]